MGVLLDVGERAAPRLVRPATALLTPTKGLRLRQCASNSLAKDMYKANYTEETTRVGTHLNQWVRGSNP